MSTDNSRERLTRAGLNLIQQAISIFDSDLKLAVSNRPYQLMFNLPEALTRPGTSFEETIRFLVERGEYGEVTDIEESVSVWSMLLVMEHAPQDASFCTSASRRTCGTSTSTPAGSNPPSAASWN